MFSLSCNVRRINDVYVNQMAALLEEPTTQSERSTSSSLTKGNSGYVSVSIDRIVPGSVLRNPLYDRKGVLLIKSGVQLTAGMLEKLHSRNITYLLAHRDDVPYVRAAGEIRPDGSQSEKLLKSVRAQSFAIDPVRLKKVSAEVSESIDQTRDLLQSLTKSAAVHLDQPRELVDSGFARIQDDTDIAIRASLFPEKPSYPAGQGNSSATVAMSMGLSMGLDERSIRELGIGCLLHDAGMLKMGRDLILSTEKFGPEEARQIVRHVEASSEMLANIRNVPHECRLVSLQMHERTDGRGYPNHISGEKMHPLSRIAAVADCYVAMISPRLYRRAHTPYRTIEYMLHETRKGRFDQASMRALLSVVSLFPIGSLVELSDGRIARVIRANRDDYVRPIVEILLTATWPTPVEIVDLKDSPETKIARILE